MASKADYCAAQAGKLRPGQPTPDSEAADGAPSAGRSRLRLRPLPRPLPLPALSARPTMPGGRRASLVLSPAPELTWNPPLPELPGPPLDTGTPLGPGGPCASDAAGAALLSKDLVSSS